MRSIIAVLTLLSSTMLRSVRTLAFQPSRVGSSFPGLHRHNCHARTSFRKTSPVRLFLSTSNPSPDDGPSSLSPAELVALAREFINNKNAAGGGTSSLDGVFDMCSPTVDLYGLRGDDVRPGFISFFETHEGLHHELLDKPVVVGEGVVQYAFTKRFKDADGESKVWMSMDPAKPRNKVERLHFDAGGKLLKVSVMEEDAPLD